MNYFSLLHKKNAANLKILEAAMNTSFNTHSMHQSELVKLSIMVDVVATKIGLILRLNVNLPA